MYMYYISITILTSQIVISQEKPNNRGDHLCCVCHLSMNDHKRGADVSLYPKLPKTPARL